MKTQVIAIIFGCLIATSLSTKAAGDVIGEAYNSDDH